MGINRKINCLINSSDKKSKTGLRKNKNSDQYGNYFDSRMWLIKKNCIQNKNYGFSTHSFDGNNKITTYLNTISPRKSDGACHCSEIPDFGDGDVCVAVLSKPPQLMSLAWLSAGGANRPTWKEYYEIKIQILIHNRNCVDFYNKRLKHWIFEELKFEKKNSKK